MKRVLTGLTIIIFLSLFLASFNQTEVKGNTKDIELLDIDDLYYIDNNSNESAIFKKDMVNDLKYLKKIEKKETETREEITSIPVLNYHFFYENDGECNENICLKMDKFREQLNYLRDNGYKTLTIDEFKKWMYGEEKIYDKAVLITIDDGAHGTSKINGNYLIPTLEEYKMHATLFLITAWWDIENYKSDYLNVESHGYDIHRNGDCGLKNIECLSHEELYDDFKTSIDLVDTNTSFAYPFYDYTDDAISVLKELDFKIAFVGGSRNATREDNKYLIPRYPIYDSTSMDEFIGMVK